MSDGLTASYELRLRDDGWWYADLRFGVVHWVARHRDGDELEQACGVQCLAWVTGHE